MTTLLETREATPTIAIISENEKLFLELTTNGLTKKIDEANYAGSAFFFRGNTCMFEYDAKSKTLHCSHFGFVEPFRVKSKLPAYEILPIAKEMAMKHLGLPVVNCKSINFRLIVAEQYFESKSDLLSEIELN